jgi:hypothetical protein
MKEIEKCVRIADAAGLGAEAVKFSLALASGVDV